MNPTLNLGFLVSLMIVVISASQQGRYKHFDEYLVHLDIRQKSILIEEVEVKVADLLPFRSGYKHNKDEKCCMLGNEAGVKGFHCYAPFYAKRIRFRNYNRAQNKKIPSLLKGKPDPTTEKLMETFGRCVNSRGYIFQKCCRYAAHYSY